MTFTGQVKRKVHQAVADAFLGPCPPKHEVRHLDGNPANNCVSNLAYGTRAQNVADAIAHGTFTRGEKNGVAKLSDKQVASIKAMLEIGARGVDVAFAFGVSKQAISSIRAGHNWAHIQPDRGF
ncbi:HNH endonuclease [Mesorhizobium sp.]|uniref:HNH endonuclease n=1 Tax=Mesorhizobium sp. TaxID=1871066 RepID=UPI00257C1E66|nr:HNH endonuclease [Mesorhizobium sp.]